MPRRSFRRPPETLPPDILPRGFAERHDLFRRLVSGPLLGLTPPRPWAPMTDEEWAAVRPLLPGTANGGSAGRPMADARARLDAIFRAVTLKRPEGGRAPWRLLPPEFGKADTAARTFRRWAKQGVWERLLAFVSDRCGPATPATAALRYRACCAFRRAARLLGLRGIVIARRLGLYSALPAPSQFLPDPDLSEIYMPVILRALHRMRNGAWRPPKGAIALLRGMLGMAGGRARITRAMEPA